MFMVCELLVTKGAKRRTYECLMINSYGVCFNQCAYPKSFFFFAVPPTNS